MSRLRSGNDLGRGGCRVLEWAISLAGVIGSGPDPGSNLNSNVIRSVW